MWRNGCDVSMLLFLRMLEETSVFFTCRHLGHRQCQRAPYQKDVP